ncbi:MAG: BrnT family toxin [Thermoanaerobaculia bacterium]
MKFEWDPKKASVNVKKHGVTFEEAATAFADWDSITVPDPEHSIGEERWYLLGVSERGNLLVVCHTEQGDSFRIVSAWDANRRQRRQYEEQFEKER